MKFFIEHVGLAKSRLGRLAFNLHDNVIIEQTVATPMCMLYTHAGSVPHLTIDVLKRVTEENIPMMLPLPNIHDFKEPVREMGKGIGKFIATGNRPLYLSVQDSAVETVSGFNSLAGVAIFDHSGKKQLDMDSFLSVIESYKPNWFQCLCDSDTPKDCSKKRALHSVNRSLEYLDKCLESRSKSSLLQNSAIFGSILGGYQPKMRHYSAKETATRAVDGFVIEGFHTNGPAVESINFADIGDILQDVINFLPCDKPRILHGGFKPAFIIQAIESGIDVFDTSYPYLVAERGCALIFDLTEKETSIDLLEIDLCDEKFKSDMSAILPGCTCYTCSKFTKAYINHLLVAKEMLSSVLLMVHNLHHFLKFFECLRKAVGTDSLAELKKKFRINN